MELAKRYKTFLWLTRIEGWPRDAALARVRELHGLKRSKSGLKLPPEHTPGHDDLMAYHFMLCLLQDPKIDNGNEEEFRLYLKAEAFPK